MRATESFLHLAVECLGSLEDNVLLASSKKYIMRRCCVPQHKHHIARLHGLRVVRETGVVSSNSRQPNLGR